VEAVTVTAGGVTVEVTCETGGVMVAMEVTADGMTVAVTVALDEEGVIVTQEDGARVCEVYTEPGTVLVVVCDFGWTYLLQAFTMISQAKRLRIGGTSFRLQVGGGAARFFVTPLSAYDVMVLIQC
jgi:hypothetical protein